MQREVLFVLHISLWNCVLMMPSALGKLCLKLMLSDYVWRCLRRRPIYTIFSHAFTKTAWMSAVSPLQRFTWGYEFKGSVSVFIPTMYRSRASNLTNSWMSEKMINFYKEMYVNETRDRQCTCNVTWRRIRVTIVSVEKREVLNIVYVFDFNSYTAWVWRKKSS
jgi:hypothetical protein